MCSIINATWSHHSIVHGNRKTLLLTMATSIFFNFLKCAILLDIILFIIHSNMGHFLPEKWHLRKFLMSNDFHKSLGSYYSLQKYYRSITYILLHKYFCTENVVAKQCYETALMKHGYNWQGYKYCWSMNLKICFEVLIMEQTSCIYCLNIRHKIPKNHWNAKILVQWEIHK